MNVNDFSGYRMFAEVFLTSLWDWANEESMFKQNSKFFKKFHI